MEIPKIKVAEVFIDGRCVGFLSDVKLSKTESGDFDLEGEWSGYSGVLDEDKMFTISIPRYECRFLADKVDAVKVQSAGRVAFLGASFLPESPGMWFEIPEDTSEDNS